MEKEHCASRQSQLGQLALCPETQIGPRNFDEKVVPETKGLENEKIERHIMKHVPGGHNLFVSDQDVNKRIENLYNRFKVISNHRII